MISDGRGWTSNSVTTTKGGSSSPRIPGEKAVTGFRVGLPRGAAQKLDETANVVVRLWDNYVRCISVAARSSAHVHMCNHRDVHTVCEKAKRMTVCHEKYTRVREFSRQRCTVV